MTKLSLLTLILTTIFNLNSVQTTTRPLDANGTNGVYLEAPLNTLPSGERPAKVILGFNHSSALMTNGNVYMWGRNQAGQLGNESTDDSRIPVNITQQFPANDRVTDLFLGQDFSSALTESGQVFMWGQNNYGQLGNGSTTSSNVPVNITNQFPSENKVIALSLGTFHVGALTDIGRVYVWGFNGFGEIGDNSSSSKNVPLEITSLYSSTDPVVQISMGNYSSSARTQSGSIFTWGWNGDGQLGDGTKIDRREPVNVTSNVPLVANESIDQLFMAGYHAMAFTSNRRVFTWGKNHYGQLGNGTLNDQSLPGDISNQFPAEESISSVSIGFVHTSALTESGNVYIFGHNFRGRLGDGGLADRTTPFSLASRFPSDVTIAQISMGASHSSALTTRGSIYIWGFNLYGQLGIDSTTQEFNTPQLLNALVPAPFSIITLDTNEGDPLAPLEGEPNTPVVAPAQPTRTGYTFAGWYTDEALTTPYVFTVFPETDLTLYAKWTINSYTLTFLTDGGTTIEAMTQNYGTSITSPADPTKKGYTFVEWNPSIPTTMPAENLNITAMWELNVDAVQIVIDLIAALPPIADITTDDAPQVEAARLAYDDLIDEQKQLVTNYETLIEVELKIQSLSGGFPFWVLLLLIPIGYVGYRYRKFFFLLFKKDKKDEEETEDKNDKVTTATPKKPRSKKK